MFEQLILEVLSEGPKRTQEQYELARQRQPRDRTDTPCPHRERISNGDKEWMHELRRNQTSAQAPGADRIKERHLVCRLTRPQGEFRFSNFDFRVSTFGT
jgi:hypothetical protein